MAAAKLTDLDLLDLQIAALFTHDRDGRIRAVNEPGGGPAPRMFFGRTRTGNRWRVRHDVPELIVRELDDLAAREPVDEDLARDPVGLEAMLAVLGRDQPASLGHRGPAYRFPVDIPVTGDAIRITPENRHLLRELNDYLHDVELGRDAYQPRLVVVEDGVAVAICNSARLTTRAAEAGVETLEAYRGRGHAPVVVAAWANAIRVMGRIPLYSTSWDNLASQAVARKLGLIQYATDLSLS